MMIIDDSLLMIQVLELTLEELAAMKPGDRGRLLDVLDAEERRGLEHQVDAYIERQAITQMVAQKDTPKLAQVGFLERWLLRVHSQTSSSKSSINNRDE